MNISADQMKALTHGQAVPVEVGGTSCILLRQDIYEGVEAILDVERAYPLVDESFRAGWEAPGMEDYDRYEELKKA